MPLSRFGAATRQWFEETFGDPTPVQDRGWSRIADGDHTLMLAPTGSGKTLAAFLWCIDHLVSTPAADGYRVLYVSPLKALAYDIERNLTAPLAGIAELAQSAQRPLTVDVRTGDTTAQQRRSQLRRPGDILITTPESLFLLLGSRARQGLRTVETVIVDEIHAVAGQKRGVHLALSLERLSELCDRQPQRIGLSATQRPLSEIASYLGGDLPVSIVDASEPPKLDLQIVVPIEQMESPLAGVPDAALETATPSERTSIWPSIYPRLLELIKQHRSTILFVNSRRLAERMADKLNELAGVQLVRAHHGSVARHERETMEELLKAGELPAIAATSSLELGIDMGAVDLVVQIESPGSVARGLQRIGRAGHSVGGTSRGRVFPKYRGDLLEAAVVCKQMEAGAVEALRIPKNALDVLAQQVVAMCVDQPRTPHDILQLVQRAYSFRDLSMDALAEVLDMLAGRYPSDRFAELRPRLSWNRDSDELTARRGAKMISLTNAGTIPDRGLYAVVLGEDGPRVGELDEEMVYEARPGETFVLGATTWRIEKIDRDRVIVSPAPGEPGKMPFWHGDRPGRPVELGRAIGRFVRNLDALDEEAGRAMLQRDYRLDPLAASNLVRYVAEQREATGTMPTDRAITVERFRDEVGDWRIAILSPLGARVHAPWTLAIEALVSHRAGYHMQAVWSDDGIVLRLSDADELPATDLLFPDPDEVHGLVTDRLAGSALFAGRFREAAARALLLPRRRPGQRTPLFAQRLRAQNLMSVAQDFPAFPITLEAFRECLVDVFDLDALAGVMRAVGSREISVDEVDTPSASPFARGLVFDYVAAYLYEGDSPLAERKAQALSLDRHLLRELLGTEDLRELLDADAIAEVACELDRTLEHMRARDADEIHDLLRRLGDMTVDELAVRSTEPPEGWLRELFEQKRAAEIQVAGQARIVAAEDLARYRDGLGIQPPADAAAALLGETTRSLRGLLGRFAATHGPFVAEEPARRLGVDPETVGQELRELEAEGSLLSGEFSPSREGVEWCDPDVLRRLKRRTLSRLRNEVAPVESDVLGRFLPRWQGVGAGRRGLNALRDALARLEGTPVVFSELESKILPARVDDYQPRMLDELGAAGELVWIGRGALGGADGKVALYSRERVSLLAPRQPEDAELGEGNERAIADLLAARGASFFVDIRDACSGDTDAVLDALWSLVWSGHVTNDTFAALRSLGARKRQRRGKSLSYLAGTGRWAPVAGLLGDKSDTERAHGIASALLDRYGVVSAEAAAAESIPGGFSAIGRVLRAMEEAGKVRRGYFVDKLSGAQFAHPGAVDRLRDARRDDVSLMVLAATDPANPWGALLSWPVATNSELRPSRRAGNSVVLVRGLPALYVEPKGKKLTSFSNTAPEDRAMAIAKGLPIIAARVKSRSLRIETIDGQPARTSPMAEVLTSAGFRSEHRGFALEA